MRSRLLIGAAGWLLGVVTATAGSLYAVDQLGQGLLAQHTERVSVAMVNSELAQETSERPAPEVRHSASPSPSPPPSPSPIVRAAQTVPGTRPRPHAKANPAKIIATVSGTAEAGCLQGGAYLVFISPGQGYDIHSEQRGPAPVASVRFANSSGGVVLRVTCSSSGYPVKHVSTFSWDDGPHHDE